MNETHQLGMVDLATMENWTQLFPDYIATINGNFGCTLIVLTNKINSGNA